MDARADTGPTAGPSIPAGAELSAAELYAWQEDLESGREVSLAERSSFAQAQDIAEVAERGAETELAAGRIGPVDVSDPEPDLFTAGPEDLEPTEPLPVGAGLDAAELEAWRGGLDTGRPATPAERRAFALAAQYLAATSPSTPADHTVVAPRFRPASQADLAPSGEMARIRANLAALRTLRTIQATARPATSDEQAVLARWSGWGAVPAALDDTKTQFAWVRQELAELLDARELAAARRTVINAHYTDAALVEAIWQAVSRLGFSTGRVLEPGCGSGNFIAYAPDGAEVTGVELDPSTAAIAAALQPQATILAESFADTRVATGGIDLVIGNVPFGDVRLHDKRDNRGNHAIHNHFILKSLRAARPGGLVAVITSAYTMDATNPAARREMQQMADLVGAVRLPSKAHARAAGTDALTDVLIFRRREDDRAPAPFDWETTAGLDVDGVSLRVNDYFLAHPQRVLGHFAAGDGLYRHDEVSVVGDPAAAPTQLSAALAEIAARTDLTMSSDAVAASICAPAARLPQTTTHPDGYLRANPDGTFARLDDGQWEPYAPPKTQAGELRALLGLRDVAVALLEAEAVSLDDTTDIDRLRATLNTRYDAYQASFGPINRFTEVAARRKDKATGKMLPAVDEETGEPIMRRDRPRAGGFRHDPFAPVVRALEIFNEEDQRATKADIFRQRVVAPRPPRLGADTPAEAVAICLDDYGEIRLDTIAWLLGIPDSEARAALGTLVFDDPATGRLEPAAAYLSGDVKTKLTQARTAADDDDRYAANVAALTEVVPRDLGPDEITIKMGAPWIDPASIQQFLTEILDDPTVTVEYGGGALWTVGSQRTDTVAARSTWGTERRSATEIAQHILEQREFVIKDTVGRGSTKRTVVNVDAIMAATEKAVEMRERFADWVWEDAERAAALVATYNETFQRYVPRSYDDVRLSLPGLAVTFQPDPHQVAAVARVIHEPAVGLYHAVGAGKTASMIMGAMELRRLGLARKPVVVVPNQLLDQWTREFLRLYPQAKVLSAGTEDMKRDKGQDRRRLMVARMATGDWDAVILTEDAFEMLPMSTDAEQAYVDAQMADFDERISEARARGEEKTLKRLETLKANREARLEERLDTDQDAGIWWELTGIDYIFRDESHRDKNLRTVSNVSGMSIKGSQRAQQMDMKLAWLRERQPRWGTRATGTPIANSIVELFTEYRFLRPDLMAGQGVTDVDSFLATYAEGEVVIEVTPDGGGLRNKTRFKFVNLDELITPTRVFSDVKNKDELGLERPPLAARADGERAPELVLVAPSDELLAKVADLVDRAARLKGRRPEKGEDNILKIVGEGAAAALDLALVGLSTGAPQKLDIAAKRIADLYHVHLGRVYTGPDGQPQPTTGALQMVFCDLGTPSDKPGRFSSYGKLRSLLAARGVPADKVRFIHEARDDKQRAELFAACRDGRVAVLVGSTEKMGTGVNVQDRLLALHHLDCPWRPCDLEQREGRIDRRGNQNPEIHILRYVTERSLDAFRWQKVAYKAKLADQILRGQAGREADDIGEATLSYEEMKAAATGNPLLVDHAKAKADLTRLERLERGWHRNQSQLHWTVRSSRQEITIGQALIAEATAAIAHRTNIRGDAFTMTVRGRDHTKRAEANDRLKGALGLVLADPANRDRPAVEVGHFGGFAIAAKAETMTVGKAPHYKTVTGLRVELVDAPGTELRLTADDLKTADLVTRLDNRLAKLEAVRDHATTEITRRETEIARAEQELAKPFRHAAALVEAKTHFQHLDVQVVALAAAADAETGVGEPEETDRRPADDEPTRTGPDHGSGQEPTPVYGDHHTPARPRPTPSTSAVTPGPGVTQVLAQAALPADQHRWLTTRLHQLTDDPQLRQVARANDYDHARLVIDERIPELFVDAFDATDIDGQALSARFFHKDDRWFREALTAAASFEIYRRARESDPPTPGPTTAADDRDETATRPADPTDADGAEQHPMASERLPETLRARRGHDFYPPPQLAAAIPRLHGTDHQPAEAKILYAHYFGTSTGGRDGSINVWLAEYDPSTGEAFGYGWLDDPANAEWRSIHLPELEPLHRGRLIVERDLEWIAVPAGQAHLPGPNQPGPVTPLTDLLAKIQPALGEDHQRWLHQRLANLAGDLRVQAPARAGDLDEFRRIFSESWENQLTDAFAEAEPGPTVSRWFFTLGRDQQRLLTGAAARTAWTTTTQAAETVSTPPPAAASGRNAAATLPADTTDADPADPSDGAEQHPTGPARLPETLRVRRGHDFYPPPQLAATIPQLRATEHQPDGDKVLHLHYFGGSTDVWLAEYDPATGDGYGYICLGYPDDAEWGYVSLPELEPINQGLLIIERDLHWTPVPASQAHLPGHRAPQPAAAAAPAPPLELTAEQRAAVEELSKDPGEPWSIHREWRARTFARLSADDLAALPPETRQAITDAVTGLLESPAWKDRATARRLLHRWSDTPAAELTDAQQRVLDVLCHPDSSHGVPDAGRVGRYGRLTAAEYLALDAGDRDDIRADLKEIAASGATKTIPRNRTNAGTTIRGVPADHVTAAGDLLRRLGPDVAVPVYRGNADSVGHTVVGLRLNPGDQVEHRRATVTVDRVGIDLAVHLVGGGTLPDSTRRYRLVAAGPDPATGQASAGTAEHRPAAMSPVPADTAPAEVTSLAEPATPHWLDGVAMGQETASGQYQMSRRANRRGDSVWVEARHPQLGMLPRGRIDLAAAPAQDAPPTWRLIDPDGTEVGQHTGAYLDAEAQLLAATSALDELLSPQQLADIDTDADPEDQPPGPEPIPADLARPAPVPATPGGDDGEEPAAGHAEDPEPATTWTDRIQIVEGTNTVVRGTTGAPREERLRGLLKQYNFRYRRATGEWRYAGRPADRAAAVADLRRWLDTQSRAEAARHTRPGSAPPPTEQQQRIIDAFAAGQNVAVQALAGTGKTSTLLMLAAARPTARIAYIAFNRSIADEAGRKFGRNVRADTSHAFAREGLSGTPLQPKLARVGQGLRWPEDWAAHLGITGIDDDAQFVEPETIARMVMATVRTFRESSADTITGVHLPKYLPEGIAGLTEAVLRYAAAAWTDISDPAGQLLFDHDDYLKLWALGNPRLPADVVFFDEAQDINDVLRKVIQQQPQQTIVVGDSNQSIYGFRGAIDALKHWPADATLPLTQSWRFGPGVAAVGNQFLRLLHSSWLLTGNPAITSTIGPVDQPDAVLARTNAGAVAAVFDAVDTGRTVALMGGGRAIQEIAQAAKDLQAGRRTKHPELSRFTDWDEVRAFCEDGDDAQSLRAFVRLVDRRGADGLLRMVHELIDEDDTNPDGSPAYDVIVSTVHKSKGREWDHVRVADDFPQPKEDLTTRRVTLPGDEELRLAYVAVTRAKRSLEMASLSWIDDLEQIAGHPRRAVAPHAAAQMGTARALGAPTQSTAPVADAEPAAHRSEPAAAPAASPETTDGPAVGPFSAVEQALIRNAVADHAAGYHGGPLGLGRDSAARYTSEGHLKDLVAKHGRDPVWEAVAAVIDADPSVLERSWRQREDGRTGRRARAEQLSDQALAAVKQGDYDGALRLIDDGELIDPEYRPGSSPNRPGAVSWAEIREEIEHRRHGNSPPPVGYGLDDWLATRPPWLRAGLPETARRWIEQQIGALVADPTVGRAAAAATGPDDLADVVDRMLFERIDRTQGWQLPEARDGEYFTWYFDRPTVQHDLHAFARRAVFQAIRAGNPAAGDPPTAGSPDASTLTAAGLARLDTAPGVTAGPGAPAGARSACSSATAAPGRRAGGPGV